MKNKQIRQGEKHNRLKNLILLTYFWKIGKNKQII